MLQIAPYDPPLLSDQSLRGHLGLPSGLPFAALAAGRLPRYEPVLQPPLAGQRGKLHLPDKEFRSNLSADEH